MTQRHPVDRRGFILAAVLLAAAFLYAALLSKALLSGGVAPLIDASTDRSATAFERESVPVAEQYPGAAHRPAPDRFFP